MEINLASKRFENEDEALLSSVDTFATPEYIADLAISHDHQVDDGESKPVRSSEAGLAGRFARWLVYVGIFLMPLWFLPTTFDVIEFNKQALLVGIASVGLVLYLIDMMRRGSLSVRRTSLYWGFIAIFVAGGIVSLLSLNHYLSIFGVGINRGWSLISMTSFAILFFLLLNMETAKSGSLKKILTISLCATLLFGVLQVLGLLFLGKSLVTPGLNTVGSMNALGMLGAVALAFFMSSEDKSDRSSSGKAMRYMGYVGVCLSLILAVILNWWAVWIVVALALLLPIFFDAMTHRKVTVRKLVLRVIIVVVGATLTITGFSINSIKSKLPLEVSPSYTTSYMIGYQTLKHRPMGYGLENFSVAYDLFKPAEIVNSIFYNVRFSSGASQFSDLLAEGGSLMVLSLIALLVLLIVEFRRHVRHDFFGDKTLPGLWSAIFALIVVFFLYPVGISLMTLFIALLALVIVAGDTESRYYDLEESGLVTFVSSSAFVGALVFLIFAGYMLVASYKANIYLGRASKTTDENQIVQNLVQSINNNKYDTRVYQALTERVLAGVVDDLVNGPSKDETKAQYSARVQGEINGAIGVATNATEIDSSNAQTWFNRAYVYQNFVGLVGGSDQIAIATYLESLKRNPNDPLAYYRIGNVYLTDADQIENTLRDATKLKASKSDPQTLKKAYDNYLMQAQENFGKSIALYNNFGPALYNLAAVYERRGQLKESIANLESVMKTNPNDPSVAFQLGLLYYRNNQKDKAFSAWQAAVTLFPKYSNARWYLSLMYEERGDLDNALAQVKEIQKSNPDNELVQQRIDQLEAGKRIIPPSTVLEQKPL